MEMNEKSPAQWQALLDKKEAEITALQHQVDWLTQQLRLMRGRRFGAGSERTVELLDQISFFNEAEAYAEPTASEPEPEENLHRKKKQKGKRELDLSQLPTERVIHELPEEERVCPECGGLLHPCGQEILRRELVYIPAQYKVREHIQTVYSCRQCEKTGQSVPMKKSNVPAPVIPGSGLASASLLAHILNSKYTLALPLYRQEQEFARLGVPISRQTMANWIIYIYQHWFSEVFQAFRRELIKNEILHADETSLMVLQEEGRKAQQKSYVWVYRTSGDAKHPVVLYDYQPSRSGTCASSFLDGFHGLLHTDGYDGYHCKLPPEITVVGCWAHMRRKFADTMKSMPKDVRERSPAQAGLEYCNRLFALEESWEKQSLPYAQRYQLRLEKSKPVAQAFFAWAKAEQKKNPVAKSMLGTALTYAINQENWLMNVFLDGRLELSNNRAERAVRPFAIGRKNWLFCNTPNGADASAAIYSVVETAKANHLRPYRYIHFLLEKLLMGTAIEECLPWNPQAQAQCK